MNTIIENKVDIVKSKIPQQLQKDGFGFVKLNPRTKIPAENDWTNKPYSYLEIQAWRDQGGNYGVLGGYGGLIIIDADTQEIVEIADKLPQTFTVKTPKQGYHYYFFCEGIDKKIVLKKGSSQKEGDHLGEIIAKGAQVVGPGSIHPDTGTEYKVVNDIPIATINRELIYSEFLEYIPVEYPQKDIKTEIGDIKITDVLDKAGIQLRRVGDQLIGSHPVHGSETGSNFVVHPDKNVWHCFRDGSGGGPLSLIAVIEGIISCHEARPGGLRGDKFIQSLKVAKEKYGFEIKLKDNTQENNKNLVQIADKILSEYKILYSAGNFYKYENGYYNKCSLDKIKKIIKDILKDDFTSHKAKEVIYALEAETYVSEEKINDTNLLNVKNGLLDLETFNLYPHTPDVLSTIQLVVNYNPHATCNKWKQSLNEIFEGDKEKIDLLQEIYGLCLTVETKYEKALFCIGEGSNGKSVILYALQKILGKDNYCAIPLERFDNGHYIANLFGKLANISIETNAKSSVYDSVFKAVISGDPIEADPKFKNPFTFTPKCKLIFALNNMPRVDDKTPAFFRRLLILRFNRTFKAEEQNKNLKYEFIEELDGIFVWCLEGLKRLRKRGDFNINSSMQDEINEYKKENNNVLLFIDEQCEIEPSVSITKKDLYEIYKAWCEHNGHYAMSKNRFGTELMKHYDIKDARVNKERFWAGIRADR